MIRLINRTGKFMSQINENQKTTLNYVGKFIVQKMNYYVPYDTGYLMSRNEYVIKQNELFIQNDCKYAGYQEYGTYKMKAQPFMKPAIYNHLGEIKTLFREGLSRGVS